MNKQVIVAMSLALAATAAHAKFQSALPAVDCAIRASDLSVDGEPLSYEKATQLHRGVRLASNGAVQLSPVTLPNGREAQVAVEKNGCVRIERVLGVR